MRQFILFTARADNGSSVEHRTDLINRTIEFSNKCILETFPSIEKVEVTTWVSSNNHFAAVSATNEPEDNPFNPAKQAEKRTFVGIEGYLTDPRDLEDLADSRELLETSLDIGGCFAAFISSDSSITAVTDASGTGGAYSTSSRNLRILSSRSLLAHLVARADDDSTSYPSIHLDPMAIRNIANSGYLHAGRTSFVGVDSIPPQSSLSLNPWGSSFRSIDVPFQEGSDDSPWQAPRDTVESISESLVDAFKPLRGENLSLSLTGGRDSRILLAAAGHVDNLTVSTQTRGEADNPDVVLAQRLASAMNVPHHLQLPERSAPNILLGEDPSTRISRVLDMHDWSVSAWDDAPDYGAYSVRPSMSGVGGEILRGGMVRINVDRMESSQLSASLLNVVAGAPKNFYPGLNDAAKNDASYYSGIARTYPYEAGDRFYRLERNNRWVSIRRSVARLRSNAIDPLLDNRFLQKVLLIPAQYRWQERLAYDVINYLAPQIADFPIEGYRWRFDRLRNLDSLSAEDRLRWNNRRALSKPSGAGIKPWHTLEAPSVRSLMRDFVVDRIEDSDYGIFNRKEILAYMNQDKFSYPSRVWHIATALHMLNTRQAPVARTPRRPSLEVRDAPGLSMSVSTRQD